MVLIFRSRLKFSRIILVFCFVVCLGLLRSSLYLVSGSHLFRVMNIYAFGMGWEDGSEIKPTS